MILSKTAILVIRGSRDCKDRLKEAMNVSDNTLYRWLSDNESNGDLTKAIAIQIISEETGLANDQILIEDKVEETN